MIHRITPIALGAWATFFALWAWIGRVDWRDQKIRHHALAAGALLTALSYAGQGGAWLFGASWAGDASAAFWRAGALNVFSCVLASVLLWRLRVWPAGDSKLFILLGVLYPVMNVTGTPPREWLFLAVLINVFVPAALYLFARSAWYVFQTRLLHQRRFLMELGWRRELIYYRQAIAAAARGRPQLTAWWGRLVRNPREPLARAMSWLIDLSWMTVVSMFLRIIASPLTQTAVCFLVFFLWGRAKPIVGRGLGETAGWAAAGVILWVYPVDKSQALALFGRMSVFTIFVSLGMNLTFRSMLAGLVFLLPFSLPLSGMVVGRLSGFLAGRASPLFAWVARAALTLNLALLGLFFGAAWLLSKLADEQLKFVRVPGEVIPGLLPRSDFLDEVRRLDAGYYERTLGDLYADGLTVDQAKSLARWCRRRSIRTIPVTPTISFASWIFLGYFLSFCLGGGHVMELIQ